MLLTETFSMNPLNGNRHNGQELCSVSAALDRLFKGPKLPVKDTEIVFSVRHDDLTLMAIQNRRGLEVIIGK